MITCSLGKDHKFYFFADGKRIPEPKYFDPYMCVPSKELGEILDKHQDKVEARKEALVDALNYYRDYDEDLYYTQLLIKDREEKIRELKREQNLCSGMALRIGSLTKEVEQLTEQVATIQGKIATGKGMKVKVNQESLTNVVSLLKTFKTQKAELEKLKEEQKKKYLALPSGGTGSVTRATTLAATLDSDLEKQQARLDAKFQTQLQLLNYGPLLTEEDKKELTKLSLPTYPFKFSVLGLQDAVGALELNPLYAQDLDDTIKSLKGEKQALAIKIISNIVRGNEVAGQPPVKEKNQDEGLPQVKQENSGKFDYDDDSSDYEETYATIQALRRSLGSL